MQENISFVGEPGRLHDITISDSFLAPPIVVPPLRKQQQSKRDPCINIACVDMGMSIFFSIQPAVCTPILSSCSKADSFLPRPLQTEMYLAEQGCPTPCTEVVLFPLREYLNSDPEMQ